MKKRQDNGEPTVRVVDRRPWASQDGAPGAEAAPDAGPAADAPRYPSYVEELQARAEAAERRTAEVAEAWRQAEAGLEETRRRLTQDVGRRAEAETARLGRTLVEAMLPVLDDLERALRQARESGVSGPLASGVELVRNNFLSALQRQGVERIETTGLPYDPETSEAIQVRPAESADQDGTVVEELAPGYRFRGTLVRPARVIVGRAGA